MKLRGGPEGIPQALGVQGWNGLGQIGLLWDTIVL